MYIPNYGSRFNFKTCQIYIGLRKKLFKSIDGKFLELNTFFMKMQSHSLDRLRPTSVDCKFVFCPFFAVHREAKIHTAFL